MIKIQLEKVEKLDYARNEAFKSLRTNLMFCGEDIRKILMTSCTQNEGKSTVSFYLAMALAEDGKKVVLIDADLRKSVLIGRLGVTKCEKEIRGLSHYLSGQDELEDVICQTDIEGLHIIFSGPSTPNPTELLGNRYFDCMLSELSERFDYVIIDAPPLGSVIDAAVLARVCDGSILIVESNHISYRAAQNVKKQLEQANCKVLGAILNKVEMQKGYYKGYYRGYYKKYYGGYSAYGEYQ